MTSDSFVEQFDAAEQSFRLVVHAQRKLRWLPRELQCALEQCCCRRMDEARTGRVVWLGYPSGLLVALMLLPPRVVRLRLRRRRRWCGPHSIIRLHQSEAVGREVHALARRNQRQWHGVARGGEREEEVLRRRRHERLAQTSLHGEIEVVDVWREEKDCARQRFGMSRYLGRLRLHLHALTDVRLGATSLAMLAVLLRILENLATITCAAHNRGGHAEQTRMVSDRHGLHARHRPLDACRECLLASRTYDSGTRAAVR
jgi:hypothetical protein